MRESFSEQFYPSFIQDLILEKRQIEWINEGILEWIVGIGFDNNNISTCQNLISSHQ